MIERVQTGVYGLDELIEGGFPKGRTILVSGGTGAGKTIFGMQYLYRGAVEYGEPGVFVTLDERPELIRQDMTRFNWDIPKLEKKNMIAILDASSARAGFPSEEKYRIPDTSLDVDRLLLRIMQVVDEIGAKRLVLDSVAGLSAHIDSIHEIRRTILKVNYMLMRTDVTAVITSEVPEQGFTAGPMQFSKYGVEEYVADGVIVLHYLGFGTSDTRTLYIRKMRGTRHAEEILPMHITQKGIVVRKPEEPGERIY